MSEIPPYLLTEAQAASYLSISPNTLRKQRSDGERDNHIPMIPYVKMGRSIRYIQEDLDAYIEQLRVTSTS